MMRALGGQGAASRGQGASRGPGPVTEGVVLGPAAEGVVPGAGAFEESAPPQARRSSGMGQALGRLKDRVSEGMEMLVGTLPEYKVRVDSHAAQQSKRLNDPRVAGTPPHLPRLR